MAEPALDSGPRVISPQEMERRYPRVAVFFADADGGITEVEGRIVSRTIGPAPLFDVMLNDSEHTIEPRLSPGQFKYLGQAE